MTDPLAFLAGGGEATRMILSRDWSDHPLGPPATWPAELRAALSLVLNSPESMILAWGPELHFFFNETYFPLLGPRLPWAMGARFDRVWADGWAQAEPIIADAMAGRPKRFVDMPWRLDTDRGARDTWWTFSYSRVLDAAGAVAGLFILTGETTDRVLTDAARRESEARLTLALDAADLGTWSVDFVTGETVRSPRHDAMFGYAEPQPEWGVDIAERHVVEADRPVYRAGLARAMATGTLGFEVRVQGPDGVVRWVAPRGRVEFGADGRPLRMHGVIADVTEQRTAQDTLARSEARYRTLFDAIDEGFCIIEFLDGPDGPLSDYVHVEANPAYARHAGIPDVVGRRVRAMVPEEAAGWVELYGAVLRTGRSIRFERELVATGRHLELAAFRIEPAARRQVAVLFQDITARKAAEGELLRLNQTLEARVAAALAERNLLAEIVERTTAFVQVIDPELRWLAVNGAAAGAFERAFGVRPRVGDRLPDLLAGRPEDGTGLAAAWARALSGEVFVQIMAFGHGDARRHHEMRFSALTDADGAVVGAYQFAYDVTERLAEQDRLRATEEALRQSQKMEAVGQLTGGLAHDFNNLLAGISGSLEMMQARMGQGRVADVDRYMAAAQGAAKRAAALTHRLLAFSRRQTLDPRPTDVNRLVAGMEELIRRTVGPAVAVEVAGAADLWTTLVDPPQLENALLNLCINARDAMPDGGRITIETANRRLDAPGARSEDLPPGQYLALCVTDTGTGMSPEVAARVFEPFFTTKPIGQGTGLGLSMIYGFARQSGGQVRIRSTPGRGTTVCVHLPRHLGAAEADDPLAARPAAPRAEAGETVLVVDDEPTVRMLVTEILEDLGYTALEAADSAAGLALLQSDVRIDLLVTDVGLPGGMNGRQMADAGRAARPGLKVLFITGYAETAVFGDGRLDHGMQVITKPFVIETLGARIRAMIAAA